MAPYSYDLGKSKGVSPEEFQKATAARLQKIKSHLAQAPRGVRLKDKVCVVSGVSSLKGIGRATALLYAHEGARALYLLDLDSKNLPELKTTIESTYPGVKVTTVQGDVADESVISNTCEQAIKDEGRLDVFFANAGLGSAAALQDTTPEFFMEIMRVNVLSCFLAIKHASQAMMKTNPAKGKEFPGGSIILTASVAGLRSGAGSIDYSASKAAVNSLAKTSAYQLQKTNIRVNSICPGLIETGMTEGTFEYARQRGTISKVGQLNPLGRYGAAEEIAQASLFLASDDSSYVNGQNIAVDGGLSASHPVVPGRVA